MRIRVLICDDHALFREGVKSILALHPEFEVVGEAEDGREAVERATRLNPDVVRQRKLRATRRVIDFVRRQSQIEMSDHIDGVGKVT